MSDAVIHVPTSAFAYEVALTGLTRLDEQLLRSGNYPKLYDAGVEYKREAGDVWRHVDEVNRSKWGDCEDLAAWRAAELRVSGEDPGAHIYVYRSGPHMFHAVVGRGDGRIEDPSLKLGMKVSAARRKTMPRFVGETRMAGTGAVPEYYRRDTAKLWDQSDGRRADEIGAQEDQMDDAPGYDDVVEDQDDEVRDTRRDQDDDQRNDDTGMPLEPLRDAAPARPVRKAPDKRKAPGKRGGRFRRGLKRAGRFAARTNPMALQAQLAQKVLSQLVGEPGGPVCGLIPDPLPEIRTISFDLYNTGHGWSGVLRMPLKDGNALTMATTPAPTRGKAGQKAQNIAKALNHPLVKNLMPPQARLALTALQSAPAAKALSVLRKFKF